MNDNQYLGQEGELFVQLVNKALKEPQSEFFFIRSGEQRKVVKEYIAGINSTISIFVNLVDKVHKTYLEQIQTDQQDLGIILSLKQFIQCRDYYLAERKVAEDILDEYRAYIGGGHIGDTLVGNIRKEEDLVDYRTLPTKGF